MRSQLTLEDVRVYARCPLEWFWEKRAGLARPQTVATLLPLALRQAVAFHYQGHAENPALALAMVWRDWCESWGVPDLLTDLTRYAQGRAHILDLFVSGKITRPGGGLYTVPQMTKEYRERMHAAGLIRLGSRLDDFARSQGLLLDSNEARPGSALGDVFADCMTAMERTGPGLPAREVVLEWGVPYQVELGDGAPLRAEADLVVRTADDKDGHTFHLEVHDFDDQPRVRAGVAGRDLRVIAASLAQPVAERPGATAWGRVSHVLYRHWRSGQTFTFRETNSGHLLAVVAAVARGLHSHVIVPRALTSFDDCRACAYREQCWGDPNWESLPLIDMSLLGRAEHLRQSLNKMKASVGGDARVAERVRQALAILETSLSEIHDPAGVQAVIGEARHLTELIAPSGAGDD